MTDNVSRPLGRLDAQKVPRIRPICGAEMPVMFAPNLAKHLRSKHADRLGRATPADMRRGVVQREFADTQFPGHPGTLYVVWIDFPYNVQRLDPDDWKIEWAKDGRAVPVNEGEK